jgi:hypothetical protein
VLQITEALMLRRPRGVVDGDEGSGTADHLGRRHRALWTGGTSLVCAGVVGIGAGNVGTLVGHGALAVAAAVGHGLAVVVGARDTWVELLAVPLLLLIVARGRRGGVGSPELHRHVIEGHWEVVAGDVVVARPAVLERGRATPVIELLEAVVESHTHAAVDTEVVVRFIGGAAGGISRGLLALTKLGLHHGEIKAEMIVVAVRVTMEGISGRASRNGRPWRRATGGQSPPMASGSGATGLDRMTANSVARN